MLASPWLAPISVTKDSHFRRNGFNGPSMAGAARSLNLMQHWLKICATKRTSSLVQCSTKRLRKLGIGSKTFDPMVKIMRCKKTITLLRTSSLDGNARKTSNVMEVASTRICWISSAGNLENPLLRKAMAATECARDCPAVSASFVMPCEERTPLIVCTWGVMIAARYCCCSEAGRPALPSKRPMDSKRYKVSSGRIAKSAASRLEIPFTAVSTNGLSRETNALTSLRKR